MSVAKAKLEQGSRWDTLDHVRALAALLVFTWHFLHTFGGAPVPYEGVPSFPVFSVFDEGHVGVSIFMVLSGYLFAKLLDGRRVNFGKFFLARVIRLAPLATVVFAIVAVRLVLEGADPVWVARFYLSGIIRPIWPHGGWSLAIELQFYALLPIILAMHKNYRFALLTTIVSAIILRVILYIEFGTIQYLSYWTIVGRIDQLLFGMIVSYSRDYLRGRTLLAVIAAISIIVTYHAFNLAGGFTRFGEYPSETALWIVLPTIEAITFGILIGWYDNSVKPTGKISSAIAKVGFYSYGIYLLHFFFVFEASEAISRYVDLSNFAVSISISIFCFLLMVPFAWLAYHIIEKPFQRLKVSYTD